MTGCTRGSRKGGYLESDREVGGGKCFGRR